MNYIDVQVAGSKVECCINSEKTLVWPAAWTDELESHGFLDAATSILAAMPSQASEVPWIIGSGRYTLFSTLREDSASHMEGRAFDMSPMVSPNVAIEVDSPISGLAWNLADLLIIAQATSAKIPFVVEGDHLHVQPSAKGSMSPGTVFCCWTYPDWYVWSSIFASTAMGCAVRNTVWKFDLASLALTPPSPEIRQEMLDFLSAGDEETAGLEINNEAPLMASTEAEGEPEPADA